MTASNKVRLRFAKSGDLRLVSHHDLMRCLERMVRRAALPVAQTQGFNPRPRIVFTLALALGIEGRREIVDIELSEPMEATEVLTRLQISAPPGFDWLMSGSVGPGRSAQAGIVHYMLENLPADRRTDAIRSVAQFLASTSWPHLRHRPGREVARPPSVCGWGRTRPVGYSAVPNEDSSHGLSSSRGIPRGAGASRPTRTRFHPHPDRGRAYLLHKSGLASFRR